MSYFLEEHLEDQRQLAIGIAADILPFFIQGVHEIMPPTRTSKLLFAHKSNTGIGRVNK